MAGKQNLLRKWFPTTKSPVVICAPMYGSVNGTLAAEVTKARGLGFVTGGYDFSAASHDLTNLEKELSIARRKLCGSSSSSPDTTTTNTTNTGVLPIGVGFLTCHPSTALFNETALPIIVKHKPAAVWLFITQPGSSTQRDMIASLRREASAVAVDGEGEGWPLKIFVQVGTVAAAREALEDGADCIVAQGVDAGGHQWAQGSGVISLVPEILALARAEKHSSNREIAVVAAGGIAHGSSVAAVLALGADGAVMGTKFVVAEESSSLQAAKDHIVKTTDGGVGTVKSMLHDYIEHRFFWPEPIDGRALVGPSILDERAGVSLAENQEKLRTAAEAGDSSRIVVWAGTGVGLINEISPAASIVAKNRAEALESIRALQDAYSD